MSAALPIPRSPRQVTVEATPGQTVFSFAGDNAGVIWDTADLVVQRKIAPATRFSTVTTGFAKALVNGGIDGATATFSVAPRPTSGDPAVQIRLASRRIHERSTDVSRSGKLHTPSLEREFDKGSTIFQELRRDVDAVPAELEQLREEMADLVLGQVPDGSMALAKFEEQPSGTIPFTPTGPDPAPMQPGLPGDIRSLLGVTAPLQRIATRAALTVALSVVSPVIRLTEAGTGGDFAFNGANMSVQVAADPQQGLYIPPPSDPTGASGAWVRQWDGRAAYVQWWNVKADNSTPDQTALQAAISSQAPELHFPVGTALWASANPILPVSGQKWVASGIGPSTIKLAHNAPTQNLLWLQALADIEFHGLTFDFDNKTPTGMNGAMGLQACDRIRIRKCRFINISKSGLNATGLRDSDIDGCTFVKNLTASTQNQAILLSDAGRTSYGIRIDDNTIAGSGVNVAIHDSWITRNKISGFGYGAGITTEATANSRDIFITDNEITGGAGTDANGYVCGGIENWAARATISRNRVYLNAGSGIENGGPNCTVSENTTRDNGIVSGSGIVARYQDSTYNGSNSTFSNNRSYDQLGASGTQLYGYIEQSASLSGIVLSGNNFTGNKTASTLILSATTGILMSGILRGALVTNNNVTAGQGTGARYVRANGGAGVSEGGAFLVDIAGVLTGGFGHKSAILGGTHDETVVNWVQSGQALEGIIGSAATYRITSTLAEFRVPFSLATGNAYQINGVQVVGPRSTGWTPMTGTGSKGALAAAPAGTASASYVQAELQTALNRIAAMEARLKACDDMMAAHGLSGP